MALYPGFFPGATAFPGAGDVVSPDPVFGVDLLENTWYLGPLGDLRPLSCPEPEMKLDRVRYGGVHQGLSGARVMDVTGHRTDYQFEFTWMESEEFEWIEALHSRLVPGPHYLLNPLKRNRLSLESSRMTVVRSSRRSGVLSPVQFTMDRDWPAQVPIRGRSVKVSGLTDVGWMEFDMARPIPLLTNEKIVPSVWVKSNTDQQIRLRLAWWDADSVYSGTDIWVNIAVPANKWYRIWMTDVIVPDGVAACTMSVFIYDKTSTVKVCAPQLETGDAPTPWQLGGAASKVLIDQLQATSPRYPYMNGTLTLLEA